MAYIYIGAVHPYTVTSVQVGGDFLEKWGSKVETKWYCGAMVEAGNPHWLCIPHPYWMYMKCLSTLICFEWGLMGLLFSSGGQEEKIPFARVFRYTTNRTLSSYKKKTKYKNEYTKSKKNNTGDSNVVPHRSTNPARQCLTALRLQTSADCIPHPI